MEIIKSENMWNIILRTLDRVDPRLVSHGQRVAYLVHRMLLEGGGEPDRDALMTALLHDVGAYKTEEIDRMVDFETGRVWEHSVYGYLFLRYLSPLGEAAQAVLYHHTRYDRLNQAQAGEKVKWLASLIKLADRVDILQMFSSQPPLAAAQKGSGSQFSPEAVRLLHQAQQRGDVLGRLRSGAYATELAELAQGIRFTKEERRDYLRMLAYSIDFRSEFMVLHTVTTVCVSVVLCRWMGLAGQGDAIYYGALLHDLGKVSTPISILEKPGKLTGAEMEIMRRHVVVTGEILNGYLDEEVYRIAVRHHEKLDGSGYPLGLKGEEMSLAEGIVAVADILSALIRRRSYKEAFDRDKTCAILREMMEGGLISRPVTLMVLDRFDALMEETKAQSRQVLTLYQRLRTEYPLLRDAVAHRA